MDSAPNAVEDLEIMPDAADRILAELAALRGQLDRLETRIERVEVLGANVAVLERQDETDREANRRIEQRVDRLEDQARTIIRLEGLEARVDAKRAEVERLTTRITKIETSHAVEDGTRLGVSRAVVVAWTALTAAPGLVGLAIALWKLAG